MPKAQLPAAEYEDKTGGLEKRRPMVLDTVHYANGDTRDRSFGFHHRQRPRPAKQEMPPRKTS